MSAVAPTSRPAGGRLELGGLLPSGCSLLVGLLILAGGLGLYAAARTTSAFAIERVEVTGAPPEVAADVRKALEPALGQSLLGLDLDELGRRAGTVPMVAAASFDRGFPHTLEVAVLPEVPVAVLRQGAGSWLVAAGGRIVGELDRGAKGALPRIWLGRDVDVRVGERVSGQHLRAVAAVAPLVERPLPFRVASVEAAKGLLTLRLRPGIELRLGGSGDLAVKLEVARRVLRQLAHAETVADGTYLDVSVPERPVAGTTLDSQVEVDTSSSTVP